MLDKILYIFGHFRPVVTFFEHGAYFINPKMTSQGSTIHFLNQQFYNPTLGNTQPTFFKMKALINMKFSMRMRAFLKQLLEIFVILILLFDHHKVKHSGV